MANFWDQIKNLVTEFQPKQGPAVTQQTHDVQQPPGVQVAPRPAPRGPHPAVTKIAAIHQAGRSRVLLRITYSGVERMVEAYSFRQKSTGTFFMGYCLLHDSIHSFNPDLIESIELTDIPYSPRNGWMIEVGRG